MSSDGANKVGRPTDYCDELANKICERLSDGESLRAICSDDDMPNKATVFKWLYLHPEFNDQYARAREEQAEALADEITSIADEVGTRSLVNEDGEEVLVAFDATAVARNRLRIDARKWVASKLKPKKYGEKMMLADSDGNNLPAPQFIIQPVMAKSE